MVNYEQETESAYSELFEENIHNFHNILRFK